MKAVRYSRNLFIVVACAALLLLVSGVEAQKVSRFGIYEGYSEETHDGWNRYSVYVPMRDGVEIALDYLLPTSDGVEESDPLPVVLHYTRYIRALERNGLVVDRADDDPVARMLLRYGYAVAAVDARGTGASFGTRTGEFSAEETADSYEIIEWLAAQPWCDGNVGMIGRSYPGMTQYLAATQAPPHLRAIFPEMAGPILYDFVYQGGTYKEDFLDTWGQGVRLMDLGKVFDPARVDADTDGSSRSQAISQHRKNLPTTQLGKKARYRDSVIRKNGVTWTWSDASSIFGAEAIRESGVAVYHLVGWYDIYTTQQPLMYVALEGAPQKMMIGPWTHSGGYGSELHQTEVLRWYDYWLKGINNKIMKEKPVHYFLMEGNHTVPTVAGQRISDDEERASDGREWQTSTIWPPKTSTTRYYFAAGPSGTVASQNDGSLATDEPGSGNQWDDYVVDYSSAVGTYSRWITGYGTERLSPAGTDFFDERTAESEMALTYTSERLSKNLKIVGSPVVHLWVSSSHSDGDFFVYLEEVDEDGHAHYVTEGALRASHRALSTPPFENLGLPYHPSVRSELVDLPDEPAELVVDLLATAIVIDEGHRIRLSVVGADALNHSLYPDKKGRDAPTVSLYRDRQHASFVEVPVLKEK